MLPPRPVRFSTLATAVRQLGPARPVREDLEVHLSTYLYVPMSTYLGKFRLHETVSRRP